LLAIILTGDATPWLRERPWLAWLLVPPTVFWAPLVMVFCPLFHRVWHVSSSRVRSVQYGKAGSSYARELPNQGFAQLRTFGPFALVHQTSGKRLVWPRWLRRERATYVFVLRGDSIAVERSGRLKAIIAKTAEAPPGLFERAVQLAQELGIHWSGAGGGIYRYTPEGDAPVWRAYSDWAGQGASVDIDAVSGEVVMVQEEDFERRSRLVMPEKFRPTEAEALAFLQAKAATVGWIWPAKLIAEWDNETDVWHLRSEGAPKGEGIQAEVRGKRGQLRLARMSRI
jgi:hypothetical protein